MQLDVEVRRVLPVPLLLAALAFAGPAAARAELVLTLQLGNAWVAESDLALESGATDLVLRDVVWEDRSFEDPPYYDVRLTWWLPRRPAWGVALDLTHSKAHLERGQDALARGRLDGRAVDGVVEVGDVVDGLSFSHGLNTVTLDALRRWQTAAPPGRLRERGIAFYAGAGAGVAVPHVEATVDGVPTRGYELAGPALRGLVGLDVPIDDNIGIVGEAVLSWLDLDVGLAGGGSLRTELLVPQLTFGLTLRD